MGGDPKGGKVCWPSSGGGAQPEYGNLIIPAREWAGLYNTVTDDPAVAHEFSGRVGCNHITFPEENDKVALSQTFLPWDYKSNSDITCRFYWYTTSESVGGTFEFVFTAFSASDLFDMSTAGGLVTLNTFNWQDHGNLIQCIETHVITIDNTPSAHDIVYLELRRKASDASGEVRFQGLKITYERDI